MSRLLFICFFVLFLFQPAWSQETLTQDTQNQNNQPTRNRGLAPAVRAPGTAVRNERNANENIEPTEENSTLLPENLPENTIALPGNESTTRNSRSAQPERTAESSESNNNAANDDPADNPAPLVPENLTDAAADATDTKTSSSNDPSLYRSEWAKSSVRVLEENGISLPDGVNYDVLIAQDEFIRVLAQASLVPVPQLREYLLFTERSNSITRGEAIHLLLGAFGLIESLPDFKEQISKFKDLPKEHPAYASIVLAERVKLINGYPDRTIRPNEVLSWGEALILVETVYSWRKALPTTAPEWVKKYQQRQNMWYQLIDGFRLLLTLAYVGLALYFIFKNWYRTRHRKDSPHRRFSLGLGLVVLLLGGLWISELLFNYSLIPREVYAVLAMLSIFVSLFLLKLGSDIDSDLSKPKPQVVIDHGYIEAINHERGELFIRDKASNTHSLALVTPDSKVTRRTGVRSTEPAFISDIQVGDEISLRGSQLQHDSLLEVERLTQLESQKVEQNLDQYAQNTEQVKQKQQLFNQIFKRNSSS